MAKAVKESKDEYKAENVFFVPPEARWSFLLARAKQPYEGRVLDPCCGSGGMFVQSEKLATNLKRDKMQN